MTLTVDGKSTLHIMKKGKKTDTNTKDPLYLGGLPKGTRPKSLDAVGMNLQFLNKHALKMRCLTAVMWFS